jgi:hypothetical protein
MTWDEAPPQDEIVEWESEMKYDYEQYLKTVDEDEAISFSTFKRNALKDLERDFDVYDAVDREELYG